MTPAEFTPILDAIGYFSIFSQILLVLLAGLFIANGSRVSNKLIKDSYKVISDNSLILAFFVSLFAVTGSLFLSDFARLAPCKLCWFQRVFMFPQVILLGLAAVKNDYGVKKYVLALSITGSAIAIYHYLLQMSPIPLPCTDEVVDCAAKQLNYFGYITIPFMSLTAFLLIIILMLFVRRRG
jgi:disulfide bond formation protein DsbB